jgi:predicted MFS family arabinose efflux permease
VIEARVASQPLVPLRLFRVRSVTGANLVMFCFGVGMFAMWYFLSLYLQQVLGYSPVVTGITFLPQTMAIAAGATLSGRLSPRLGPRNVLMLGGFMAAGGLFWLSFVQAGDSYWTGASGGGILATFGMGLAFTPIALLATGGVPHQEAGLASGLVNCSRQIGASVGLAALTTLAASRTAALLGHPAALHHRSGGHDAVAVALTAGYARAFLVASVAVLAGGLLGLIIPPPGPPMAAGDSSWTDSDAEQASVEG